MELLCRARSREERVREGGDEWKESSRDKIKKQAGGYVVQSKWIKEMR